MSTESYRFISSDRDVFATAAVVDPRAQVHDDNIINACLPRVRLHRLWFNVSRPDEGEKISLARIAVDTRVLTTRRLP